MSSVPSGDTRRWLPGALALGALPLAIAVDTGYAWARGFSSSNATPFVVAALALTAALVVVGLGLRPRGRRWLGARARHLTVLAVAFALAWLVAELVVAFTLGTRLRFHHGPPGLSTTLRPREDIIRGVHGPSRLSFNALGIRGREWPTDRSIRRILCVGGSTTLCYHLDDTETWPAVLEASLQASGIPCWVGNLGQNAYGTRHHVVFTRHSSLLGEADEVVFLVGFNDFIKALLGGPLTGGGGIMPLWLRSPLLTAVQNAYQARRARGQFTVEDEFGEVYAERRRLRQSRPVTTSLPDLTDHLDAYRENLRAMLTHVRAAGARPLVACNPTKWRLDGRPDPELWFGHTPDGAVLDVPSLHAGMHRFEVATRTVVAEVGAAYVDLSEFDGLDAVFFDDCHFTEEGARRVAAAFAPWFGKPLGR